MLEYLGILDAQVYLAEQINNSKMCLATEIENIATPVQIVLEEVLFSVDWRRCCPFINTDGEDVIIVALTLRVNQRPFESGRLLFGNCSAVGCRTGKRRWNSPDSLI